MKYLHSMIRTKDIKASLRFYQELLGLKLLRKSRLEDCTLYFLAQYEGAPEIELTDNDEIPSEGYKNGNAFGHFAFECEDMDAFSKKVEDLGYEFMYGGPFVLDLKNENNQDEKKTIAFIKDPDGNEVEIIGV